MSGIYIPGVEMPAHCMDCPFMVSRDNDDCILQSTEANESFENWEQMRAGCPLIPVPEHGRLIDADASKSDGFHTLVCYTGKMPYEYTAMLIDDVPTIIPADKDGER